MKLSDMMKFFSPGRYQKAKAIFNHPFRAHYLTTLGMAKSNFTLEFKGGELLHCPKPRRTRKLWNFLLNPSVDCDPVQMKDQKIQFHHQGQTIFVRPLTFDFFVFREIFLQDTYRLAQLPKELDTVVDLGANIGFFSLRIAQQAKRVIALEPVSSNREMAGIHIEKAGLQDKITLLANAAGGESGKTIKIFLSSENFGCHSVFKEWSSEKDCPFEEVTTLSLAQLFEEQKIQHCDLLKCDIEGAEYDVFFQTPKEITEKISHIAMEGHVNPTSLPYEKILELQEFLSQRGFEYTMEGNLDKLKKGHGNYMLFGRNAKIEK